MCGIPCTCQCKLVVPRRKAQHLPRILLPQRGERLQAMLETNRLCNNSQLLGTYELDCEMHCRLVTLREPREVAREQSEINLKLKAKKN